MQIYAQNSQKITLEQKPHKLYYNLNIKNTSKEKCIASTNDQDCKLFSGKFSAIIEGEIKIFHDKCSSKEFVTSNPNAQRMQKGMLETEEDI